MFEAVHRLVHYPDLHPPPPLPPYIPTPTFTYLCLCVGREGGRGGGGGGMIVTNFGSFPSGLHLRCFKHADEKRGPLIMSQRYVRKLRSQ